MTEAHENRDTRQQDGPHEEAQGEVARRMRMGAGYFASVLVLPRAPQPQPQHRTANRFSTGKSGADVVQCQQTK